MELQQALEQLSRLQAKMAAYNHAMALIYYDGATTAPKGTAANRGQTLSILSEESYRLSTGKDTVELLEFLDAHREELSEREARTVFLALKSIRELKKIPMEEYVAYQQLLVEAEDIWHTAKETDDFALFCPFLERIFEFEKKFAAYCAPEKKPYDYCLDKYEGGLTMEDCDAFIAALRSRLVPLIQRTFHLASGASLLAAIVVLTVMILPSIVNVAATSLRAVPKEYEEASLALGATEIETIFRVIVPAARSGIATAVVLGVGRAIGEAMAIIMVSGNVPNVPKSLFAPVRFLTTAIASEMSYAAEGSLQRMALYSIGLVLFLFIMCINVLLNVFIKRAKED